jgi:hypothetical protein
MDNISLEIFATRPEADARRQQLLQNGYPVVRVLERRQVLVGDRRPGPEPPKPVTWTDATMMYVVLAEY